MGRFTIPLCQMWWRPGVWKAVCRHWLWREVSTRGRRPWTPRPGGSKLPTRVAGSAPEPLRLEGTVWALPSGGLGVRSGQAFAHHYCHFLGCLFRGWMPPAWCLQESSRQPRRTEPVFRHVSVQETAAPRGQVTLLRWRRWGVVVAVHVTNSAQRQPHLWSPRAAHLDPVQLLRLPWLSQTTPTRHGFLPSGPVCIFPSGLLIDVRRGSLKMRDWILRVLTHSPRSCCRLRAGHLDGASPCGLGFPTARWRGSQTKCREKRGVVVQSLSRVRLFAAPWTAARQASLSFTSSLSLLKLMSIESMMSSNHLILCCPLLLLS